MRQIMIVNLDNRTYHLDEEAFADLRRYLDRARAGLQNDPDLNEVLADFERSIAEKCAAALIQSGKNMISLEEMNRILEEMGPVAGGWETAGQGPAAEEPTTDRSKEDDSPTRKLQKQPRGAKLSGVCSGLADYFGIDAVFIRIAFVALTLFAFLGLLAYIILEVLMPSPQTYDRKRYPVLKATLFGLSLGILYFWANSLTPNPVRPLRGNILGLRIHELLLVPLMIGIWITPFVAVALIGTLAAFASVKYLRSSSRGK